MKSPVESDQHRRARRRTAIFRRDGFRCVYCGRVLPGRDLTVDHVQPRMRQGDQSPGNLVTACATCNILKGGRAAWEFLRDRETERLNFLKYAIHVWPRLRRAVEEGAR